MALSADELLERLQSGDDDDDGEIANALLKAFYGGYPVERLRTLLYSDNPLVAARGAWLASELTRGGRRLLADYHQLLRHPVAEVRYEIVNAILYSASADDGELVAAALRTAGDPDPLVRSRVPWLLAHARLEMLAAAVPYCQGEPIGVLLEWLLEVDQTLDTGAIIARLDSANQPDRLFAAAAAFRVAMLTTDRPLVPRPGSKPRSYQHPLRIIRDQGALRHAAQSGDETVRTFAECKLESISSEQALQARVKTLLERRR